MLDLSDATNAPLFGAALTAFNARNSDTVRQNATSFTPGGQLVSPQFFPFGGPSVPVNSNVAAVGHLTANGTAGATNYFGFAETAGAQIGLYGKATQPPNQGTELLLYDNNGNLVAIASGNAPDGLSSIIDFTVPTGTTEPGKPRSRKDSQPRCRSTTSCSSKCPTRRSARSPPT